MKQTIKKHLINVRGRKIKEQFLVFESDDWGSIRIPNVATRESLVLQGLIRIQDPFSRFDTLETAEDYKALFKILKKHKDANDQHPIITTNFILNNPDFDKIAAGDFTAYYDESFLKTYSTGSQDSEIWNQVKEGISTNLIKPQFHGTQHLNVIRWMKYLQEKEEGFRFAFKHKCFAIDDKIGQNRRSNVMATYDYNNQEELDFIKETILKGLNQFEEIFGFKSQTTIAPCYVWDEQVERILFQAGVHGFQGTYVQNSPQPGKNFKKIYRYNGQKNLANQTYFVRNGLFEPSLDSNVDWVKKCLESIEIAFNWGKPAIISTHRINFVGGLDASQRTQNLKNLDELLRIALQKWPDLHFTDSASLFQHYNKHKS